MKKEFRVGLAASLLLHAAALVAMLSCPNAPPMPEAAEPVVSVTVLFQPAPGTPPREQTPKATVDETMAPDTTRETAPEKTPAILPEPQASPSAIDEPREPAADGNRNMPVVAKSFYAAARLARPENRSAREALKALSPMERREQLCDTEAMEQLHRWKSSLQPDRLIAYALLDTSADGATLHAPGAAFRSRHQWFALSFDCTVDPGSGTITAFRFVMGDAVPKARWSALSLER